MVFWPIHGLLRRLTERREYKTDQPVHGIGRIFTRSLHIFVIDAGCDNGLNFDFAALRAPQYNIHRFGIFFADTPRHADLLVVLGPPVDRLRDSIRVTADQMPRPFGVLFIDFPPRSWEGLVEQENIIGHLREVHGPGEILAALLSTRRSGGSK